MSSTSGKDQTKDSSSSQEQQNPSRIEPLRLPTPEEIRAQDIWNNCAVRSVASGVMGIHSCFLFHFSLMFSS